MVDLTPEKIAEISKEELSKILQRQSGPAIVVACPGTGKTTTLAHKFISLCQEEKYNPFRIYAVTFTNYATDEMREKISEQCEYLDPFELRISTLHSLAKGLLHEYSERLNLPSTFRVVGGLEENLLLRDVFLEFKKRGDENALFISSKRRRISRMLIQRVVKEYASLAGITKQIYPHKFRISMITHMAESGCTVNEIKAQSGHKKTDVLLEYIQHSSERIRKSYDGAFEWNTVSSEKTPIPTVSNPEHYKEIVCKKYLDGELDIKVLSSLLESLENKRQNKYKGDIAYG